MSADYDAVQRTSLRGGARPHRAPPDMLDWPHIERNLSMEWLDARGGFAALALSRSHDDLASKPLREGA
jgi:hypothetical protein